MADEPIGTLTDEWREFSRAVIAPEAGDVQRKSMKHAFFAGSLCIMALLQKISDQPDEGNAAADLEVLYRECSDVTEKMIADCNRERGKA